MSSKKILLTDQTIVVIQAVRAGMLSLILLVSLGSYLLQPSFINFSLLGPFYLILIISYSLNLLWLFLSSRLEQWSRIFFAGFLIDSIIFSLLIHFSGVNQSLFLFLHLVNILVTGLTFRSKGALVAALFTSISFSFVTLIGPELRPLQTLFILALNNIAFFSVAGMSGYFSELIYTAKKDLKKADISLQAAEEFNRIVLENMPAGLVTFNSLGVILKNNPVAEDIFGEIKDINLFDLIPSLKISMIEGFRGDVKYLPKGAADFKILGLTIRGFKTHDLNEKLYIALIDDLTLIRKLEFSAQQNEKLAAIGGLAAGIAHEIRNPLAGISGSIELLSQTTHDDDDKKLMKIILREIDRLNNLITEFLEFARPEEPPTDFVDLSLIMSEVLELMSSNKQIRSDIKVIKNFGENLVILGHKDKLKQAFLNIVINAFQAMQDSKEAILQVQIYKENSLVKVHIKDSGSGMSEQTKRKMFEPFHTTKPKGTGLGLAVTHKILEGHKAQIFVESEAGIGTEIVLHFPLVQIEIS